PYIVVDEVRYNDKLPWPLGADGDGPSLQRRAPTVYGNEPTNWFASGITPGAPNFFNQPPSVAITSPTNGATFEVPAVIALTANASDSDGGILRVEYYEGDIKLGESTSAPFGFIWSNASVGAHTVIAKARDNGLAVSSSAPITITVTPPPFGTGIGLRGDYFDNIDLTGTRVRRIDPVVNFDWGTGSPDPLLAAETFSARWTGQVQPRFSETYTFYTVSDDGARLWVNNQLIIDRWVDQGQTEWPGFISLQAGQRYDIRMGYYENGGGAAARLFWSSPNVPKELVPSSQLYPPAGSNLPPVVALTAPATGSVFVATAPINIVADATDPDGTIFKMEFFANGAKLGEDTSSPFSFAWTNSTDGTYSLVALVTDDSGISRTSAPVNVTVVAGFTTNRTMIGATAIWKYHDQGADLASAWTALAFNDSGWSNGAAELGYGDASEGRPESTVVGFGPNSAAKYITTYFRRTFTLTDVASFSALNLRVMRDDGVVVYLNGSEVYRDPNMPGGPINYLTPALSSLGGVDEYTFLSASINPGYLVLGTNILATEIHQNSGGSSDISFALELTGVQSFITPYLITQPTNQTVAEGTNVTFSASAGGSAPLFYRWRFNGTNVNGATNATFIVSNVQPAHSGNYVLVVSNTAGSITSSVAALTVTNPDTDGDGLPNWWELAYGLNENSAGDAALDIDGDGMTALQEYRAGTNPNDALSVLRLRVTSLVPLQMQFVAQSNLPYSVQFNTNLATAPWLMLSNVVGQSQVRTVLVSDPNPATNRTRFYRAVTP
ncbi:MAG TPA: Ig-like domain-containing protein, partial [Candidatus Limnocylindria bacterium]|nr:Ig-like domain-containing protein [Candidatus Limnocylindria bacterium]